MSRPLEPDEARKKLLNLNRLQTVLIVVATSIGIITGLEAWAQGWLGLPKKVEEIQARQETMELRQMELGGMTNRVVALEDWTRSLNTKVASDHDLLVKINQSLDDLKEQQAETREDIKGLKK
jgi:hypothetical protein